MPDVNFTVLWLIWFGLFAVIEGLAILRSDKGDTLSEHVWRWFSVRGKGRWAKIRRLALMFFMVWLTVHFLTGGWV